MMRAWAIATGFLALAVSPLAHAECRGSPLTFIADEPQAAVDGASPVAARVPSEDARGDARSDRSGRLVAPVLVNGQGPYNFIIDTGANRSAISTALGASLGLTSNASGPVHTVDEVAIAPMVDVRSIEYAGVSFGATQAPMIGGPVLAGQDGLLGVDGMRGRRLVLDFQHRCFEISDSSRRSRPLAGWTRIRGQLRFGHLVLIPGEVRGHRINVLIDTGAGSSLANTALQRELGPDAISESAGADLMRAFTAGNPIILNSQLLMPSLRLGEISADNVTAYIGDFHIFDLWGLRDQPTLLVGMDVLSKARAIAIDYATGTVYLRIEQDLRTGSMIRGVTNGPITAFTGRQDRHTTTDPY